MSSAESLQMVAAGAPFPYAGPPALEAPVVAALGRVVDPELAMTIVDVGLIYGVTLEGGRLRVRLTMTSAACPVADVIVDDIRHELAQVLPAAITVETELVWEPEWSADRLSARARKAMGW